MASIFRRDDNYVEQPNRNTVDFSFQNNMTTDFGSLRPCFCTPVLPGDSFRIKPTFGLKFLPMLFPVQTRMKATIHYYYVRNRNLWKDWQDFIGKTKEGLVPPYIHLTEQNRKQVETCQLGDFLGLPTRVYGNAVDKLVESSSDHRYYDISSGIFSSNYSSIAGNAIVWTQKQLSSSTYPNVIVAIQTGSTFNTPPVNTSVMSVPANTDLYAGSKFTLVFTKRLSQVTNYVLVCYDGSTGNRLAYRFFTDSDIVNNSIDLSIDVDLSTTTDARELVFVLGADSTLGTQVSLGTKYTISLSKEYDGSIDVADLPLGRLPWRSDSNPNGIPLSALPFRAEEAIYNVYYRNAENNPFLINGVPEYNKWNRTLEGGADTNFYPIHYHNWEDDFLTTAVPSPQQGNAPLVGLSGTSTVTIGHDDGTTTEMTMEVDEQGNVVAATAVSGDEATQTALINAVSYGISINDFRNVNSFQRWLENNIRRGYKYKDQIKTHYGVSVRYDELDMPEFIGGASQDVLVNQISQTTPTEGNPLGAIAGQASSVGQGNEITHYCDEHGFIIGILCVKPVANYSQLLPKYFNITDTFDYYFPEFGHIGMQPITYAEVTPLQAHLEGKLNDVFGYQRAWYDLIAKTDEVHGLFRSDFRNFLINRTFNGTPELGKEFTVIDPNQVNDVFAYTENTDKILGQIYMEISKKTPIPLYGIPKLE